MWLLVLAGLPVFLYLLYKLFGFYTSQNDNYWPRRGVPTVPRSEAPSLLKWFIMKKPLHKIDAFYYQRFSDARIVGVMEGRTPRIFIRDPELVKRVMVKDFDSFSDRRTIEFGGVFSDGFLFTMNGPKWKSLRAAMTPTFTSGKMRNMFQHFEKSANDLVGFVNRKRSKEDESINADTRDIFGRYTMDVIGSTAFGIDSECLKDDSSLFYNLGLEFQNIDFVRTIKFIIALFVPKINSVLKLNLLPQKPIDFFGSIVSRTFSARRENFEQSRKKNKSEVSGKGGMMQTTDFLQLMIEQQHRLREGESNDEDKVQGENDDLDKFEEDAKLQATGTGKATSGKEGGFEITDNMVVANSLGFFIAGFDNTEAMLTAAAYHLATSSEIQEKLRTEVEQAMAEHRGEINYDVVAKCRYLDMFITECLRLYPTVPRLERKVTKPYKIPDTDVTLEVGTLVYLPALQFHKDPKYYPNPEEFDPEHFSAEAKAKRHPYVYMPFGLGPRSCIAMRFVINELKAAVAHLVHKFEIRTCAETTIPMKMFEDMGQYRPAKGLKLAFVDRHH